MKYFVIYSRCGEIMMESYDSEEDALGFITIAVQGGSKLENFLLIHGESMPLESVMEVKAVRVKRHMGGSCDGFMG